jgi:hypothetical protein
MRVVEHVQRDNDHGDRLVHASAAGRIRTAECATEVQLPNVEHFERNGMPATQP